MILEEYDEELHMKTLYEEGMAAGEAKGKTEGEMIAKKEMALSLAKWGFLQKKSRRRLR